MNHFTSISLVSTSHLKSSFDTESAELQVWMNCLYRSIDRQDTHYLLSFDGQNYHSCLYMYMDLSYFKNVFECRAYNALNVVSFFSSDRDNPTMGLKDERVGLHL